MSDSEERAERSWEALVTDGILTYWLNGSHDEELREWWQTDDAVECATELAE